MAAVQGQALLQLNHQNLTVQYPRLFHPYFEAAAVQNNWMPSERVVQLLSVLHGKATVILHTVLADATCEDILDILRDRFGDHQLKQSTDRS